MSAIIKILLFFIWGGVLPVLSGLLPLSVLPLCRRRFHLCILLGYLLHFALFEVIGIPFLLLRTPFHPLLVLYAVLSAALAAAGLLRCRRTGGILPPAALQVLRTLLAGRQHADRRSVPSCDSSAADCGENEGAPHRGGDSPALREDSPACLHSESAGLWAVFLLLLGFQLFMAYTTAFYDGDDAYYVTQSLQTYQTDTMYVFVPYTGVSTSLDGRHAMAMIPMWIAALAKLSGTHPTIVTHSMIPLIFLPLADISIYAAYGALLAGRTERERERLLPAMMIVTAMLQLFGNVSIYTPETFLMTRTWQGKTVFVGILVPAAICILVKIAEMYGAEKSTAKKRRFPWFMMLLTNMAAGFCTSLAPILLAALFLAGALLIAVLRKRKCVFGYALICALPNIVYTAIVLRLMLIVLLSS
ncbi:MAG: DUF6077 domain-containing protein [Lachnospiraceae bacterium]|nr:DUF6077 domain-containing protein [Lachnospiraceae bacterium]